MAETALCVRELDDTAADSGAARRLIGVRPGELDSFFRTIDPESVGYLQATGFAARPQELALLPARDGARDGSRDGVKAAVFGLGEDRTPYIFGDLPFRLPAGTAWRLAPGDYDAADAILGFCLGGYRFRQFRAPPREPAVLAVVPGTVSRVLSEAAAIWFTRDLINQPANLLGPAELADAAGALAAAHGARCERIDGPALEAGYPAIAAVGRGSARAPVAVVLRWRGSTADDDAPLISLVGKGVCFDTGGYDLKPSAAMLRMKKDMAGAAVVLGAARVMMEADLPIRLAVRIGCVENSVSGTAMRPLDVIRTRRGLSVEIGNTDAEGRLVLADLLAEAADEQPDALIDCATLTGAARVATGPDLPALFCSDDALADDLLHAGAARHDPLWRLPLWEDYDSWLDSPVADLNNVSVKPFAGAVVAALFLRRFIPRQSSWAHIDLYGWNDTTRPGRPEGGEAQALRAIRGAIDLRLARRAAGENGSAM